MCWMWKAHSGSISATRTRFAVAWGLPKVRLLRLSVGRSRLHFVHQRKSDVVQERLLEAVRQHGILCGVQQGHSSLRDGDAGTEQRLPPGMLCMSAVQSQVRNKTRAEGGNWIWIQLLFNNLKMKEKFPDWFPTRAIKTELKQKFSSGA